jgi:hypothetical protein
MEGITVDLESIKRKEARTEFQTFNCSSLRKMDDSTLASWQANYPVDSPQHIIAMQEWNNRSLSKQLNWVKFSAIATPIATLIACVLSAYLSAHQLSPQQSCSIEPSRQLLSTPTHQTLSSPTEKTEPPTAPSTKKIIGK